jgi:hypothetical protein
MLPRDLAFVGCRLLAVYIFLTVLQAQISNTYFYLQHLRSIEETGIEQHNDFAFYFMSALLNLGFCAALWFGAGWLSGKVAAGAPRTQGEAPAPWSLQSALSVVVIASGLWLLILLVPSLAHVLHQLFRSGGVEFISLAYTIVAFALGLVCVFSPRAIAGFIFRGRGM